MAMKIMESFDLLNATQFRAGSKGWVIFDNTTRTLGVGTTNARNQQALFIPTSGGSEYSNVYKDIGVNAATVILGFNCYISTVGTTSPRIAAFADVATEQLSIVRDQATGKVQVKRGATTLATSTDVLPTGTHVYIEFKANIHNTTGSFTLRFNGITQATATGQNTRNGSNNYANRLYLGHSAGASAGQTDIYIDDLVCMDDSGTLNNDLIGDVVVKAIYPDGAGANTGFTPSAGTNYGAVDETPANDDTDYVQSDVASTKDTYTYGNLPANAATVKAVQVNARAKKDDAGARTLKLLARPASTDHEGAAFAPGTSYLFFSHIWDASPETTTAWTVSEVNGSQFGIKVES